MSQLAPIFGVFIAKEDSHSKLRLQHAVRHLVQDKDASEISLGGRVLGRSVIMAKQLLAAATRVAVLILSLNFVESAESSGVGDATSFLALPPLGKGTLPKRVEQETVPGTAPDLASTLAALKAKAEQAKVPSEAQAEPSQTNAPVKILDQSCNGSQHAPDLAGDLAALLAKKNQENATQALAKPSADHLHTVRLIKQYVPIEKNGTVVAYKTAYFGKMHVGSPQPQNFTVVFDTGSAHLVIPNSACQRDTCLKHNRYNESMSESAVPIEHDGTVLPKGGISQHSVSITFGTGKVSGTFVKDKACLGGADSENPGCATVNMVVANDMSDQPFSLFHFDGILGLGLEALSLGPGFSFFGQMAAELPMQSRFSVFLARSDQGQSSISFGGHDESKAASGFSWVPVAKPELGYWQVQVYQVRIGDAVLDECADGGCRAILDTGTSLLGAPRQAIKTLHSLLSRNVLVAPQGIGNGEGFVTQEMADQALARDCREQEGALLTFDLGPEVPGIALDPEDYFRPKPFNMTVPEAPDAWKLTCRSLLLPLDLKEPLGPRTFILGEPVLRKYYTIYDWASRRVGFAKADHSQDGEVEGAIDSPEEGSLIAGAPLSRKGNGSISSASINMERVSSELHWAPVAKPEHGHWQLAVRSIRVGNETVDLCDTGDCTAIADTGTSLIGVPKAYVQKMHWLLARRVDDDKVPPTDSSEYFDCRNQQGPDIVFDLGDGLELTVGAEEYSRPAALRVITNATGEEELICRASLLPVEEIPSIGPKAWILGEPVLRKYYSAYDWKREHVARSLLKSFRTNAATPGSVFWFERGPSFLSQLRHMQMGVCRRLRLRRKSTPRNAAESQRTPILSDLPVILLRNILEVLHLPELAALQMASAEYQQILRNAIGEEAAAPVLVFLQIDTAAAGAAGVEVCDVSAFRAQSWSPGRPLTISAKLPSAELDLWTEHLAQFFPGRLLCFWQFEVRGLAGVSQLCELRSLESQLGQLKCLRLQSLEEEDVTGFVSLLRKMSLESLQIKDFAIDRPTPATLAPILRALPSTCTELDIRYVLPAVPAFAMLPATVRRIGTLVVMDEIFYYSRKVGMSLSLFVHTFPIVKHVTEVKLILGPGHYEEPSWPADGAHSFVAALNEKLPKLECVRMKVHSESAAAPPLVPILLELLGHGFNTHLYLEAACPMNVCLEHVQFWARRDRRFPPVPGPAALEGQDSQPRRPEQGDLARGILESRESKLTQITTAIHGRSTAEVGDFMDVNSAQTTQIASSKWGIESSPLLQPKPSPCTTGRQTRGAPEEIAQQHKRADAKKRCQRVQRIGFAPALQPPPQTQSGVGHRVIGAPPPEVPAPTVVYI
ncbi:Ctse [Symbiodinium microadriaticum]|nr:Ctse [Symbiodinium microadriaticum]